MTVSTTRDITLEDAIAVSRRAAGVTRIVPIVAGETEVTFEGRGRAATLIGSTPEFLRIRKVRMALGSELPDGDVRDTTRVCVIGAKIRREVFGDRSPLGARLEVGEHAFRVVGVIEEAGFSMMVDVDEIVIVPVASALRILNKRGLFRLLVEGVPGSDLAAMEERIVAVLRERHDDEEDFTLLTPGAIAAALGDIIVAISAALAGIAAISLAVAGIGVMNVMVVSVTERTAEIGLMKAIGASDRQVLAAFLAEAVALSAYGGAAGVAIGVLLTRLARALYPTIPFEAPAWAILAATGLCLAIGVGFGILPARRAARMEPLDALRRSL